MITINDKEFESLKRCEEFLNPDPEHFKITGTKKDGKDLIIDLESTKQPVSCPKCGVPSKKVKTYYQRQVDGPVLNGSQIIYNVRARSLCCLNEECSTKNFSENLSFAEKYGRRTHERNEDLVRDAAYSGYRGAQTQSHLKRAPVDRHTIKRQVLKKKLDKDDSYDIVGIDDIASKKGHYYFTVIYAIKDGKIELLDIINGRKKDDLKDFLKKHPEIKAVFRDGGKNYRAALDEYLPNAVQIPDRFHLIDGANKRTEEWVKQLVPGAILIPKDPINKLIADIEAAQKQKKLIPKSPNQDSDEHKYSKENYINNSTSLPYEKSFLLKRNNLVKLICQHKKPLTIRQRALLAYCLKQYPSLLEPYLFNFRFYRLIMKGKPKDLDHFIHLYEDEKGPIKPFINNLKDERKNIARTIKYKHLNSNGVEGYNNKIKLLKRIGFGKNNLESLKQLVNLRHWFDHHPSLKRKMTKKELAQYKKRKKEQERLLKDIEQQALDIPTQTDETQDEDDNLEDE